MDAADAPHDHLFATYKDHACGFDTVAGLTTQQEKEVVELDAN